MARINVRRTEFNRAKIESVGILGIDLEKDPEDLELEASLIAENIRVDPMRRRRGAKKVFSVEELEDAVGALDFAVRDVDYTEAPFQPQMNLPEGGFWRRYTFVCPADSPGKAVIFSSRLTGETYGPHTAFIDASLRLNSSWVQEDGAVDHTNISPPLTPGAIYHVIDIFSPQLGMSATYVNGQVIGVIEDIPADSVPAITADGFYLAVEFDPGVGVVAGTGFGDIIDAVTFGALSGADTEALSVNGLSLRGTLIKWSSQEWPNPESSMVALQYGCNEEDAAPVILDSSRYKNHATVFGAPASVPGIAAQAACGNLISTLQRPNSEYLNLFATDGHLYPDVIRVGVTT
jgi:hypothetical protein